MILSDFSWGALICGSDRAACLYESVWAIQPNEEDCRMLCPYCRQGEILSALVKKINEKIMICDECDTVWLGRVDKDIGLNMHAFMASRGLPPLWSELEVEEQI